MYAGRELILRRDLNVIFRSVPKLQINDLACMTRVFTETNSRIENYKSKHFPWTKDINWLQIRHLEYIYKA